MQQIRKTLAHDAQQRRWAYNRVVFGVKKEIPVYNEINVLHR